MDLQDQLKSLFPDHQFQEKIEEQPSPIWLQDEPLLCKYEKRKENPLQSSMVIMVLPKILKL